MLWIHIIYAINVKKENSINNLLETNEIGFLFGRVGKRVIELRSYV